MLTLSDVASSARFTGERRRSTAAEPERPHLFVLGKGNVASALFELLARCPDVRLAGVADSRHVAIDVDVQIWREQLAASEPGRAVDHLEHLAGLPCPVLVDCSAADGHESLYERAFRLGIHVVTANKKPLATPLATHRRLFAAAREHRRAFHYETTVGAALPVIGPLKDLVRTGDEVRIIEASLSGTLGFLCNELMRGARLSAAVASARALGYTEPHPADDLSGADVARKALILAREANLAVEPSQVSLEPFVPLPAEPDADRFVELLEGQDELIRARVAQLVREGKVLRYLVRIESDGPSVHVAPCWVDRSHPSAGLTGTDCFVAIRTRRYRASPMVVQGAGAGAELTASGVLADVLRLAPP